jgi:hypothetical protein
MRSRNCWSPLHVRVIAIDVLAGETEELLVVRAFEVMAARALDGTHGRFFLCRTFLRLRYSCREAHTAIQGLACMAFVKRPDVLPEASPGRADIVGCVWRALSHWPFQERADRPPRPVRPG